MTREQLWANTYIEIVKKASQIQAESAATQAVKAFDKMFGEWKLPKIDIDKIKYSDEKTEGLITEFPTEKQILSVIFQRLKESTIEGDNILTWCKYGAELDFEFDSKGAVKSIN